MTKDFVEMFAMLDDRSFALLTNVAEPARAVVFVHGFSGHPAKTWRTFDRPVAGDAWWDESDLYFFGYPSTKQAIRLTSDHLVRFLHQLLPRRSASIAALAGTDEPEAGYQELALVGHSQGGLVMRDAVLQALWEVTPPGETSDEWSDDPVLQLIANSRVRLFAPAIFGARLSGLKGLALQSLGVGTVARMMVARSPSYHELQQGSTVVADVQQQTTRRAQAHPDVNSFRARIVWAASDSVVVPGGQYDYDPRSERIDDTDHGTVCKPPDAAAPQVAHVTRGD